MCNPGDTVAVCVGWSCVGALNVVRRQVGAVQLRARCSLWGRVSLVARASDFQVEIVGSYPGLCP